MGVARLVLARLVSRVSRRATARNHRDPGSPRFAGRHGQRGRAPSSLRIVTFNVRFAREIDRAIALIGSHPELRRLDLLALQEMDEDGVERVARRLGLNYVYYPAVVHTEHGRNFGNALLSRWSIKRDFKIHLPHRGRIDDSQRIAVAATLVAGRCPVRVYNVHLGARLEIEGWQRARQMEVVLDDAARFPGPVVVMGDMNARDIGRLAEARRYTWATRSVRRTIGPFAWDHIFVGGRGRYRVVGVGVVRDNLGASDHKPVWLRLLIDPTASLSETGAAPGEAWNSGPIGCRVDA
jgi:endonuclease/exonuclease/phosphatase family metal-dependent hydrolase